MSTFADRFDAATYQQDEPVEVSAHAEPSAASGQPIHVVPERLMERIQFLARAYHLHLLPVIDTASVERVELNGQQAEALSEELAFLGDVVNDELVRKHLNALHGLARRVSQSGRDALIVFEGP